MTLYCASSVSLPQRLYAESASAAEFYLYKKYLSAMGATFTPQNIFDYNKSWCLSMTRC